MANLFLGLCGYYTCMAENTSSPYPCKASTSLHDIVSLEDPIFGHCWSHVLRRWWASDVPSDHPNHPLTELCESYFVLRKSYNCSLASNKLWAAGHGKKAFFELWDLVKYIFRFPMCQLRVGETLLRGGHPSVRAQTEATRSRTYAAQHIFEVQISISTGRSFLKSSVSKSVYGALQTTSNIHVKYLSR